MAKSRVKLVESSILEEVPSDMKDLTGTIHGNTEVIGYVGNDKWYIKCSCGARYILPTRSIKGKSENSPKSCGDCAGKLRALKIKKELIGKRFGNLTIIGLVNQEQGYSEYVCRCDCMGIIKVSGQSLTSNSRNKKTSCGCMKTCEELRKDKQIKDPKIIYADIIGKTINQLTILSVYYITNKKGRNRAFAFCKCSCMNFASVDLSSLECEGVKSCGCYNSLVASERMINYNNRSDRILLCGDKHPSWNHKLTPEQRKRKRSGFLNSSRVKTFERDNYTCQKCGLVDKSKKNIECHHIVAANLLNTAEQWNDVSNMLTYCVDCHKQFNKKYGRGYTTLIHNIDFLGHLPSHINSLT